MIYFGRSFLLLTLIVATLSGCEQSAPDNEPPELVVYSARKEHLIKPLFDQFTAETGISIRYVTDSAGPLLARLQSEGENTPADLLITVDAGNLWHAAQSGLLQPVQSELLVQNIPAHLSDPGQQWYALTIRARTLVYSTDRIKEGELSSYEGLADPRWLGRLCLRTSKKVYNQSLVATLIAALGEEASEAVVTGWVANLAMPPFSNDTMVMEAIAAGQCDVGIVNTYYYGALMEKKPDLKLALFWPNQSGAGASGRGVHINVSGAAITRYSRHPEEAKHLLEWLSTAQAQQMLMELNLEYPVNPSVALSPALQAMGTFKPDSINISEAGRLQSDAVKLMDRAAYR